MNETSYRVRHEKCQDGRCVECMDMITSHYILWPQSEDAKNVDDITPVKQYAVRRRPYLLFSRYRDNVEGLKNLVRTISDMPISKRNYSEVIPRECSRKLFVDIDDKELALVNSDLTSIRNGIEYTKAFTVIVDQICDAFRDVVHELFVVKDQPGRIDKETMKFAICTSNGWDWKKKRFQASAHIIYKDGFIPGESDDDINYGAIFERAMKDATKNIEHFKYDPRMGIKTANLRLLGNQKIGSGRIKVTDQSSTFADTLITFTKRCFELELDEGNEFVRAYKQNNIANDIQQTPIDLDMALLDKVCSKIQNRFKTYPLWTQTCRCLVDITRGSNDGLLLFDKWSKAHDNVKYKGFDSCEAEWIKYKPCAESQIGKWWQALLAFITDGSRWKLEKQVFPNACIENKAEIYSIQNDIQDYVFEENVMINEYELNVPRIDVSVYNDDIEETVAIRSGMGTGKTYSLINKKIIVEKPHLLWITHRKSFTSQTANDINKDGETNIEVYESIHGNITQHSVIVQVEACDRIPRDCRSFDLVIIDEWIGVLEHMYCSQYMKVPQRIAFEDILRTSKKVVVMDAQMDNDALKTLLYLRNKPIALYYNKFKKSTAKYVMVDKKSKIAHLMIQKLKRNKRIVVATTSIEFAKTLNHHLEMSKLKKKVLIYTSETDDSIKRSAFGNVKDAWKDADVVIYTPTCSEGVSFDEVNFDYAFGVFYSESASVEVARQLMHRVRLISSNRYYVYIEHRVGDISMFNEGFVKQGLGLSDMLKDARTVQLLNEGLIEEEHADVPLIKETPFAKGYVLQYIRRQVSKNAFYDRFITLTKQSGATVKSFNHVLNTKKVTILEDKLKTVKKDIKAKHNIDLSKANEITEETYKELMKKKDRTEIERKQIQKYLMRTNWGFTGDITPDVVKRFPKARVDELFAVFKIISFKKAEADLNYYAVNFKESDRRRLLKIVVCLRILATCGFGVKKVRSKPISSTKLLDRLQNVDFINFIMTYKKQIIVNFERKRNFSKQQLESMDIQHWLQFVNPFLISTFDCRIKKVSKHCQKYMLVTSDKFGSNAKTQIPYPMTYRKQSLVGKASIMDDMTKKQREAFYCEILAGNVSK